MIHDIIDVLATISKCKVLCTGQRSAISDDNLWSGIVFLHIVKHSNQIINI